jgi:hypothetical protein
MKDLDHLAVRDWRDWAKRVLELSDPDLQNKRSLLQQICDGTITAEEGAKMLESARKEVES